MNTELKWMSVFNSTCHDRDGDRDRTQSDTVALLSGLDAPIRLLLNRVEHRETWRRMVSAELVTSCRFEPMTWLIGKQVRPSGVRSWVTRSSSD